MAEMFAILRQKYTNLISDKKFSEVLTGSFFALGARFLFVTLMLTANIIVARIYGAESVGVLAVVNSFLILVSVLTVMGTGTSILRLIPEHIAKHSITSAFQVYRKIQYFVAGISLVTGAVFFFMSDIVAARIFHKPHLSSLFALAAIFVIFKSLMDLNTQAVRGLRLIRTFAIMQVVPAVAMLVLLVLAALTVHHPNDPVYAQLGAFAVTAVIGILTMDRAFRKRIHRVDPVQPLPLRDILSISTPMMMASSLNFVIGQTGIIMLGMFHSASDVGYYAIAVKLATLNIFVLQAINSMATPQFSELYHTGRLDDLFHVARKSTKLIFWTTLPILLVLTILGKQILGAFFGKDFIVAYPALVLLLIGQFVNAVSGSTQGFMIMTGHERVFSKIIFLDALITVSLGLGLIPPYGIIGAAVTGMISVGFWNICTLVYVRNKFGRTTGYVPMLRL